MTSLKILWEYRTAFLHGLLVTGELVCIATVFGTLVAALIELACRFSGKFTRRLVNALTFGFSTIPALVILFWLHYPAQEILGINIEPFWSAALALSLVNAGAVYRIIAEALNDFPSQFVTAGVVAGMPKTQILWYIQMPLLMRASLPRWIDQQVIVMHTSLFASLISVEETFRVAQRINSREYEPVLIYSAMALLFLITAGSAMSYARRLRARAYRDFSER